MIPMSWSQMPVFLLGKTRLCLSRFQPARHLICQGQYPPALGPFPQTNQGNDE